MIEFIEAVRDRRVKPGQMQQFVEAAVLGRIPDYQIAAWLMAVYLNGLDDEALFELTGAMAQVGSQPPVLAGQVDKHSTGGVGDKTTLILAPLVSSLGIPVLKMSGRGLGHTGGTLDKLESIPGFQVQLPADQLAEQMASCGVAVVAQSGDLAPADGIFYALRDVTATVDSLPLIASSIMSKKLAGGAPNLVLDVKVGSGALMKTAPRARALAELMLRIGTRHGVKMAALLTNMDQPLGEAIGNALEVNEAMDCLRGKGPQDLREEVLTLASQMVSLASSATVDDARRAVAAALDDGRAYEQCLRWVRAQGGDVATLERGLPVAESVPVTIDQPGRLASVDTELVGRAAQHLGAGRAVKEDPIDHTVGLRWLVRLGESVTPGTPVAEIYGRPGSARDEAVAMVRRAIQLGDTVTQTPPVLDTLTNA